MTVTPAGVVVDKASETVINEPGKKRRFVYRVEDTRHFTVEIDCDRVKEAEDFMKRLLEEDWDWYNATNKSLGTELKFLIDPRIDGRDYFFEEELKEVDGDWVETS